MPHVHAEAAHAAPAPEFRIRMDFVLAADPAAHPVAARVVVNGTLIYRLSVHFRQPRGQIALQRVQLASITTPPGALFFA